MMEMNIASYLFVILQLTALIYADGLKNQDHPFRKLQMDSLPRFVDKPCFVDGQWYMSGQKIPRDHVCHICYCFRGYIDCMWVDCPPAPEGCTEMNFPDTCNPSLYLCPIPEHNSTFMQRGKGMSDISPEPLDHNDHDYPECLILGVPYKRGDVIGVATHPCLECRCANKEMYCSPKCCFRPAKFNEEGPNTIRMFRHGWRPVEKHPLAHLREDFDKWRGSSK